MSAAHQVHGATTKNRRRFNVTEDPVSETKRKPLELIRGEQLLSSHEYERLMAGENVSWNQIMREHPMLGAITVAQLVNLGVVQVIPEYDPSTGTTDFRLCKPDAGSPMVAPHSHVGRHKGHQR